MSKNRNYYDTEGHFIGRFEKNPQFIKFQPVLSLGIHDSILAAVDLTVQYKTTVRLNFIGVELDIPYKHNGQNLANIMLEYNKKMIQKPR